MIALSGESGNDQLIDDYKPFLQLIALQGAADVIVESTRKKAWVIVQINSLRVCHFVYCYFLSAPIFTDL